MSLVGESVTSPCEDDSFSSTADITLKSHTQDISLNKPDGDLTDVEAEPGIKKLFLTYYKLCLIFYIVLDCLYSIFIFDISEVFVFEGVEENSEGIPDTTLADNNDNIKYVFRV